MPDGFISAGEATGALASRRTAARYVVVRRQSPAQQPATYRIGSVLTDQPQRLFRQPAVSAAVRVIEPELLRQQVAQGGNDLLRQRGCGR
jgi:hypothetical protein